MEPKRARSCCLLHKSEKIEIKSNDTLHSLAHRSARGERKRKNGNLMSSLSRLAATQPSTCFSLSPGLSLSIVPTPTRHAKHFLHFSISSYLWMQRPGAQPRFRLRAEQLEKRHIDMHHENKSATFDAHAAHNRPVKWPQNCEPKHLIGSQSICNTRTDKPISIDARSQSFAQPHKLCKDCSDCRTCDGDSSINFLYTFPDHATRSDDKVASSTRKSYRFDIHFTFSHSHTHTQSASPIPSF